MQRWWNLSKLETDTFVNFFNSIILSPPPPLSPQEKISSKNAAREEWAILVCLEGEGGVLLGGMRKNKQIQFFDSQIYSICSNLNTINLKLFRNHGEIYRFRKQFKKDSEEINPLRVHRNMPVCILEINCGGLGW